MDDRKFDALTRSLARGTSRRTALKGLFAGVIGGAALTTRLDHAGAQLVSCESDTQCTQVDSCTLAACIDGFCNVVSACGDEICCPAQGGSCAPCCDDGDCPAGTPICLIPGDPSNAFCVQCADAGDCAQPDVCTLASCIDNVCSTVSDCPAGTTCCDVDGVGIDCVDLSGGDMYCGACGVTCSACETCQGGICVSNCQQPDACTVTSCIGGECVITEGGCPAGETCCDVDGVGIDCVNLNAPNDQYCGECGNVCGDCEICDDGVCVFQCGDCSDCVNGACTDYECCYDSDCDGCEICGPNGTCETLICELGETCCGNHECVEEDECCKGVGEYCGLLEITAADDSPQYDCCDGLVCCEHGDTMSCAECCNDWDCPKGAWCRGGWCEYPDYCDHDKECPKGTCCCHDGSCSGKCCHQKPPKPHKPHKPAPPASGGTVSTLPATGAGPNDERNNALGVAALGAAAAVFAAKKLRTNADTQTGE